MDFIGFIGLSVWFSIGALVIGGFYYLMSQNDKEKEKVWQTFAKVNGLAFVDRQSVNIVGNYRGHHLELDIMEKERTRATLSFDHSDSSSKENPAFSKQILEGNVENLRTSTNLSYPLKDPIKVVANHRLQYIHPGIEGDAEYLQFLIDLLSDLADIYPSITAQGGAIIPTLHLVASKSKMIEPVIHQMMIDIGEDTKRLEAQVSNLLCSKCLARFTTYKIRLSWNKTVSYCGCRICGQSQEFLKGEVIAVLNDKIITEPVQKHNKVQINWFGQQSLFDFDEVEIVSATDEEVERFAMRIGNDTDAVRYSQYKQISCKLSSECKLSENTIRVLEHIFGNVQRDGLKAI